MGSKVTHPTRRNFIRIRPQLLEYPAHKQTNKQREKLNLTSFHLWWQRLWWQTGTAGERGNNNNSRADGESSQVDKQGMQVTMRGKGERKVWRTWIRKQNCVWPVCDFVKVWGKGRGCCLSEGWEMSPQSVESSAKRWGFSRVGEIIDEDQE